MSFDKDLTEALTAVSPSQRLRAVVEDRVRAGVSPETVQEELTTFRLGLRAAGRDDEENLILDAQDLLEGWCAPDARITIHQRQESFPGRSFVVGIASGSLVSAALVLVVVLTAAGSIRDILSPALAAVPALASLFALLTKVLDRDKEQAPRSATRQR